jgi:hypothetical protein
MEMILVVGGVVIDYQRKREAQACVDAAQQNPFASQVAKILDYGFLEPARGSASRRPPNPDDIECVAKRVVAQDVPVGNATAVERTSG